MKTKNMYLNRLLKLARHLGKQQLNDALSKKEKQYICGQAECNIDHFDWALDKLPAIDSSK